MKQFPQQSEILVGTGGIGTGTFFALNGNHTLGREESRGGHFLKRRDYCKLHIICHGVAALAPVDIDIYPIGRVGDDDAGRRLLREMEGAGLNTGFVQVLPAVPTTSCICLVYPDGDGGNLTVDDAASAAVTPNHVLETETLCSAHRSRGIALAVPEVPMEARHAMLQLGRQVDFFNVASFTSEEMTKMRTGDGLDRIDLLALNVDEAAALAGQPATGTAAEDIAEAAVNLISSKAPYCLLSMTAGKQGSWLWDGNDLRHQPAIPVEAASTAGAGDAHLAGIIAGLTRGWTPHDAHRLGTVAAAVAVTSPHTVNPNLNTHAVRKLAADAAVQFPTLDP